MLILHPTLVREVVASSNTCILYLTNHLYLYYFNLIVFIEDMEKILYLLGDLIQKRLENTRLTVGIPYYQDVL